MKTYSILVLFLLTVLYPSVAKADSATVSCPSGLTITPPAKGLVLWPAGAQVQQLLQLSGKDLHALLTNYPTLCKVNQIVIADYAIPGPAAPASGVLDFYLGTLRPPAWKPFYQSAKCDSTTASIAFKGKKGYISVLARPSSATVTYVSGDIELCMIPLLEQVLRAALCAQEAEPVAALDRIEAACMVALEGKTEQAIGQLKAVLIDYPMSPTAHYQIGKLLLAQQKTEEASQSLRRAISLAPSNPVFRIDYAQLLADSGDRERAQYELEQAVAFNPSSVQVHQALGHVLDEMGKLKESEASYRKAIALGGGSAEAYVNLGKVLEKLGQKNDALDAFNQALKLKANYAPAEEAIHKLESQQETPK